MSGSIIIPSNYSNYSYTNSVVPSSVLTSYSLPSHDAPYHDDEPDYPLNYEASPIDNGVTANTTSDGLPSSIYHTNVEATVTESELFSSVNDTQSPRDNGATARYQHMKMKYLRSAGIAIPATVAARGVIASSPSYDDIDASDVADVSGPSSSSSSPLSSASPMVMSSSASATVVCVTPTVTKSASVGLLARLLSERSSAGNSPASLSPSSSSSSLVGMTSSPKSSSDASLSPSSSSSSSIIPTYVRRTSPISIPKRVASSSSRDVDDGVRYRRARHLTRDELDEEERDRQRYAAVSGAPVATTGVHASRRSVDIDGEFSFADVFAAPLASSSRPIAMKSAVATRRVVAVSYQSSSMMAASHALPSSLIDGFLAL